jgi:S1-C subfamily serine protease
MVGSLILTSKIIIAAILWFVLLTTTLLPKAHTNNNNSMLPLARAQTNASSTASPQQQQSVFLPFTDLFKRVHNSVVEITSIVAGSNKSSGNQTTTNINTGYIYDNNGHIVTPESVIHGANKTVDITFSDGNIYTANVIGKDLYSDIAVLQLDKSALSQETIQPLPILSNSSTLEIGQPVAVIGSPFGLSFSMTGGMISGLNRLVPVPGTGFSIPGEIQFNGIINTGDSGPVISLDGKVVGLVSLFYSGTNNTFSGINFATPSNTIQKIVPHLIATGSYQHSWLGFNGGTVTPDVAKAIGLSNKTKGVIVGSVTSGSPADMAGIAGGTQNTTINGNNVTLGGDIVVGIDNKQVSKIDDIINYVDSAKSVGDTIVLKVLKNGSEHNVDVKLTARPSPQQP